jgi:predicted nucleotidyltransferase
LEQKSDSGIAISLDIPTENPKIFGSNAIDNLLLFLTRNRNEQFTVRALHRNIEDSKSSISRAADLLVENDLLKEEHDGNKRLLTINRARLAVPDDPCLQIPQQTFYEPTKIAVETLEEKLDGLLGIVLYGSVARGEADRKSDIDLWVLVDSDRPAQQRNANDARTSLEDRRFDGDRYSFDLDVEELPSVAAYEDDIADIVRTGITLYETDEFKTVTSILTHPASSDE